MTARFLESGLSAGERVLHLTDTLSVAEASRRLAELGVEVDPEDRALVLRDAVEANCPKGRFSTVEMIETLKDFYLSALAEGYAGARGTGEMSWSLRGGLCDLDELMDYEAHLNDALRTHPFTACCQYALQRFDGQAILDVLSVHPLTLVRGQLVVNPYYLEPSAFLARARRSARANAR